MPANPSTRSRSGLPDVGSDLTELIKWSIHREVNPEMAPSAAIDPSYGVANTPSTNSSPTVCTAVAKMSSSKIHPSLVASAVAASAPGQLPAGGGHAPDRCHQDQRTLLVRSPMIEIRQTPERTAALPSDESHQRSCREYAMSSARSITEHSRVCRPGGSYGNAASASSICGRSMK